MISHIVGLSTTAPSTTAVNFINPNPAGGASWSTTEATRRIVVPHAMTIDQLRVTLTTAPGAALSYTIAVVVNGVASTLTTTITGASTTQNQDLVHTVSLNAGDTISISSTPAGTTPASTGIIYWTIRQSATSLFGVMGFNSGAPSVAGTQFLPIAGRSGLRSTAALGDDIVPTAGTFKNFQFFARAAPGAATSWALTLLKNGVSTGITATISGASATTASDLSHTASVVAGDLLTWQIDTVGTPASAPISFGISFQPTTDGESFMMFSGGAGLTPSVSATNFQATIESGDSFNATESNVYTRVAATTIKALYVLQSVAPGLAASGKQYVFTVRKEIASTAAAVTILETATSGNITGQSIAANDDDRLAMQIAPTLTPASTNVSYSILTFIQPAVTAGSAIYMPVRIPNKQVGPMSLRRTVMQPGTSITPAAPANNTGFFRFM